MSSSDAIQRDWRPPNGEVEPVAHPLPRRQALQLVASLVAMLGVIFLLALTMGAASLGQG